MTQRVSAYFRYCPGEEHTLISDAVCIGRRRSGFHGCRGCQFNDDERAARGQSVETYTLVPHTEGRTGVIRSVFKAYDVRATYPDPLDEDVAWRVGHAAAQYLRASLRGIDRAQPDQAIVVGHDMRKSSPSLVRSLIDGIRASNTDVIDIGRIDTPQIYFAVNHLGACGGIQTTASHNPANYNGFKICGQGGRPIGANTGLNEIATIAAAMRRHDTGNQGKLNKMELTIPYRDFVRRFLMPTRPMKVAVDASNGMAGRWFPILFENLPALAIVPLNFEHDGTFVHEPNPLVSSNLAQVRSAVRETGADFGICFDGDADRLIVVDENADIVSCDLITAMLVPYFLKLAPGASIVYDLRSSRVVREEIKRHGGRPRRERVGHAFMKKALADTNGVFGGELSGHFYFRDNWYCDSGMLAFVHLLNFLGHDEIPLSKHIEPLRRYANSGERNFINDRKEETIKELARMYRDARIDYLDGVTVEYDDWWFNVRASNTEPLLRLNVEADNDTLLEEKLAEVSQYLGRPADHEDAAPKKTKT